MEWIGKRNSRTNDDFTRLSYPESTGFQIVESFLEQCIRLLCSLFGDQPNPVRLLP
jgi:hypothetical protein